MSDATHANGDRASDAAVGPPRESRAALFLRFLRFGLLAWGGPVAQIAMIRDELVERERWISRERFNRVLAVYQALPGPEAHELCVYFGMLARGRIGALLAGLGFMLPGFALMFGLSALYVSHGIDSPLATAAFRGLQAAVVALVIRALFRIGRHALTNRALWLLGALVAGAHLLGWNFLLSLALAGAAYALWQRRGAHATATLHCCVPALLLAAAAPSVPPLATLFLSGLRS
ncbi:MAG TPA: chromate transporter, partial [Myxococcota bacterium]|nr:chromate transporter [Myxococcota bacterium]